MGSSVFGANLAMLRGPAREEHSRSNGTSRWSNLSMKARVGALELAGGYHRFARTAGEGGALFIYPLTASLAVRMPEALLRPHATIGGGLYGWESRVRDDDDAKLVTTGWNHGWTTSIGVEYSLRTYVALDVAMHKHSTFEPVRTPARAAAPRLRRPTSLSPPAHPPRPLPLTTH